MRVRDEPFDLVGEVAEAAGVRCHVLGTATRIACDDAEAFLDGCRAANLRIVGAEGFELIDGHRCPEMRAILDLGGFNDADDSEAEARQFVASVCALSLSSRRPATSRSLGLGAGIALLGAAVWTAYRDDRWWQVPVGLAVAVVWIAFDRWREQRTSSSAG